MTFPKEARLQLLRDNAETYARGAIDNVLREYPHMPWFVATEPGPIPTHRELHPAFFGSFDWHSCVEMHWVLVKLLRLYPDHAASEMRETLNTLLTPKNLSTEAEFFTRPSCGSFERPYGWGWLLTLAAELDG